MKRLFAAALLALSSFAFGATTTPVSLLNPAGSTAGQAIVSTGATTAPAWATVPLAGLSSVAANTVLSNFTASAAAPAAFAMPSCSTANSALQYTSGTGLSCGTAFALTGGSLAQFAATTSAQLAAVMSDETGTGALVFGTSPTLATPTVNGAALSGTLSGTPTFSGNVTFSGLIQPTSTTGIKGTTTNDSPATGSIGESNAPGTVASAVATTSATPTNITSVSLTAGDYLVWGLVSTNPAGGTVTSGFVAGVSTTSAGYTSISGVTNVVAMNLTTAAGQALAAQAPMYHLKLTTTTTVYLVTTVTYSTSTLTTSGVLNWIRIR